MDVIQARVRRLPARSKSLLVAVKDVTGVASSTGKLRLITSELFGDTGDVTMALGLDLTAGGSEALFWSGP
jgi:hypothetical protein